MSRLPLYLNAFKSLKNCTMLHNIKPKNLALIKKNFKGNHLI